MEKTMLRLKVLLLICLLAPLAGTPQVEAFQSRSVKVLAARIEQLEREIRAIEQRVSATEEGGTVTDGAGGNGSAAAPSGNVLADLTVKLSALETQMRALTGRLEEVEYAGKKNARAIDALRQELDLRLGAGAPSNQPPVNAPLLSGSGTVGQASQGDVLPPVAEAVPSPAPVASPGAVKLPDGEAAARYNYAFEFVRQDDLESARTAMTLFLEAHPSDDLTPNAVFWLGRIHLREGRDGLAAQQFLKLIDSYPGHEKRADALVDLAEVLIRIDSAADACDALAEFDGLSATASPRLKSRALRLSETANCSR